MKDELEQDMRSRTLLVYQRCGKHNQDGQPVLYLMKAEKLKAIDSKFVNVVVESKAEKKAARQNTK